MSMTPERALELARIGFVRSAAGSINTVVAALDAANWTVQNARGPDGALVHVRKTPDGKGIHVPIGVLMSIFQELAEDLDREASDLEAKLRSEQPE